MSNGAMLSWFKSSYSGSQGDSCVEVATAVGSVWVRDSKDVTVPPLALPSEAWSAFTRSLRDTP